jgi:hypothetical protein
MKKLENLTMEQLEAEKATALSNGYTETVSVENVPIGTCIGSPVLIDIKTGNKITVGKKVTDEVIKSPSFSLIKFERKTEEGKELKLFFEAVKLNVLHVCSAKRYNNLDVKCTDDLKTTLQKPENYTKELTLDSVSFVDGQKRNRTMLKFESISK